MNITVRKPVAIKSINKDPSEKEQNPVSIHIFSIQKKEVNAGKE